MTNFETVKLVIEKIKENIEIVEKSDCAPELNVCFSFVDDIDKWISCIDGFSQNLLVQEACGDIAKSVTFCTQGFYKEAIVFLRQFIEHMLFAVLLSTNDYSYRLWKNGQYDMSWSQIVDAQKGVFGKEFIEIYANDIGKDKSMELLNIARNIYRECSEFVHGNYGKLLLLPESIEYNEDMVNMYISYFSTARYIVSMALLIRFREVLEDSEKLNLLEEIIMDNLGMLPEVQMIYGKERRDENE